MKFAFHPGGPSPAGKSGRRFRLPLRFWLSLLGGIVACAQLHAAAPPLRVLILSGQNNHDWKQTTPKLLSILTASGRFTVEVMEHPERCDAKSFAQCDVILSDWNTFGNPAVTNWPDSTRTAFLEFVRSRRGFVAVHAGSSSFYNWPDYHQLAGASWNLGPTSHGNPHEFTVKPAPDHPVTRGVAPFRTTDELWIKPGVQPGARIIATADEQPVALVTSFGKGRGFTLLLGHSADFTDTPGFQTLLLRGAEWAATGEVSLPPNAGERLAQAAILKAVSQYHLGDSRTSVLRLENLTAAVSNDPVAKADLAELLAALLNSGATVEARQIACSQLSLIGSAKQVPALAGLIGDKDLGYYACLALERIPAVEAESALLAALKVQKSEVRRAAISSLASRRSDQAVPEIKKLLEDGDPATASAVIIALGRIGGAEAAASLGQAQTKVPASLKPLVSEALLRCAVGMIAAEQTGQASLLLEKLTGPDQPPFIRIAAFSARSQTLRGNGAEVVLAALSGSDEVMQTAAVRALAATGQPALLQRAAEQIEQLPPALQLQLITLLGDAGDAAAVPALMRATRRDDVAIRQAAIVALGLTANADAILPLAALGATGGSDEKRLAVEALARLRGTDVGPKMTAALNIAPSNQQLVLIRALVLRGAGDAVPTLISLASAKTNIHRIDAISAAGKLGTASDCAGLASLLETEAEATASALADICRRTATVQPMLASLAGASPAGQAALVEALVSIGGPQALEAVRQAVKSSDSIVRLAAVRSLANWPDAAPLDDLAALASATNDPKCRALALRGIARLAPLANDRSPGKVVEVVVEAMKAGGGLNEQKALLAALGGIPGENSRKAAQRFIDDPELGSEAKAALAQIKAANTSALPEPASDAVLKLFASSGNLCRGCTATNLDGLTPDGQGQGPFAAVDGDASSYWDETDSQQLYWIRLSLNQRATVACLRILGWQHHNYAPRNFEVIGDGKLLKRVENADYDNNLLTLDLPPTTVTTIELKITGYYGQSPAIRELGLFAKPNAAE